MLMLRNNPVCDLPVLVEELGTNLTTALCMGGGVLFALPCVRLTLCMPDFDDDNVHH